MANHNLTALTLTAAAAGSSSADMENQFGSAAHVVIDITAISGVGASLTVTVEGKDPTSGKYYTIIASAALMAVATTVLRIFPAVVVAAGVSANDFLPRTFRVSAAVAGTTPAVTAKIGVNLNG